MNEQLVREDLQQGMSIKEVLLKYELTFHQLFNMLHHTPKDDGRKKRKRRPPEMDYITKPKTKKKCYLIQKRVNGEYLRFGVYRTKNDAIKVRDALIEDRWNQHHVDKICQEVGVERIPGRKDLEYRFQEEV